MGTTVLSQIVYSRLENIGIYACRPFRYGPIMATFYHQQLAWIREHVKVISSPSVCVMFFEVPRFNSQSDSHRTFKGRTQDHCYHQENITGRPRYRGGCHERKCVFMNGNARPYRENIISKRLPSETEDITHTEWSELSRDLNPTKHAWNMLADELQPGYHFLHVYRNFWIIAC
ncbi:transposable element Tcb1 transposase [Trichonephila clavipes]|nr:transposable element Tcb1 transposase [Trichonephila clavipes]